MSHLSSRQLLGEALIQFFDDMLQGPGWTSTSHRASSRAGNLLLRAQWAKRQKDYDTRNDLLDRARDQAPDSQYLQRFVIGF